MPKQLNVQVITIDAVLEFSIEGKALGRQLFDLVTRTLGLREVWYFGLMYTDSKDFTTWLRYDKKIVDQGIPKDDTNVSFKFRPKFFPEDITHLIMDITLHLFYIHCKEDILNEKILCSPEASILLASYSLQAEFGPYDEDIHIQGFFTRKKLLPPNVINQFDMTPEQWEVQLVDCWCKYGNMLRNEAEIEYMKIAQDLDMYGINYFEITNKKGTQLWLGVDAFGLNIYNYDNRISPKISFPWGEIRNVEYHGKKFCIMPEDKHSPDFVFYVPKTKISDLIMQLCVGNHDLYLKRRKVDTMEIQQMKAHAKEELARKRVERDKLEREKGARLQLEREKKELEDQLMLIARQRDEAFIAKEEAEKKAQILEERVKIAEEQTHTLTRKKIETEAEIQRVRASAIKSEEERMMMKKKVIRAEEEAASLQQTAHKRQEEANELRKKLELVQINDQIYPNQMETTPPPPSINQLTNEEVNVVVETEMMDDIREQLEKEQQDYIKHSQYLTEKLSALQNEMEDFKQEREKGNSRRQDSIISLDRNSNAGEFLHASVIRQSSYKHSAYDKSKSGSTKSRIAFFEDL